MHEDGEDVKGSIEAGTGELGENAEDEEEEEIIDDNIEDFKLGKDSSAEVLFEVEEA